MSNITGRILSTLLLLSLNNLILLLFFKKYGIKVLILTAIIMILINTPLVIAIYKLFPLSSDNPFKQLADVFTEIILFTVGTLTITIITAIIAYNTKYTILESIFIPLANVLSLFLSIGIVSKMNF